MKDNKDTVYEGHPGTWLSTFGTRIFFALVPALVLSATFRAFLALLKSVSISYIYKMISHIARRVLSVLTSSGSCCSSFFSDLFFLAFFVGEGP